MMEKQVKVTIECEDRKVFLDFSVSDTKGFHVQANYDPEYEVGQPGLESAFAVVFTNAIRNL